MAAITTATTKMLQRCLTKPCQLAHSLDWKKATGSTLLAMDIHSDRIGLARCDHPAGLGGLEVKHNDTSSSSSSSSSCYPLESIPLCPKTHTISAEHKQQLARLVKEYNVCGFVVSWPLQKDTGRLGAACGRTLFTLDQLLPSEENSNNSNNTSIVSPNRPLCLWDSQHTLSSTTTTHDTWGRSSAYARTSTKTEHVASQEQYFADEGIVAAQVWQDFCQQYWPETTATESTTQMQSQKKTKERPSLIGGRKKVSYTASGSSWQSRQQQSSSSKRRTTVLAAA